MELFPIDIHTATKTLNDFSEAKKIHLMSPGLSPVDCFSSMTYSNNHIMNSSTILTPTSPQTFYFPPKHSTDMGYKDLIEPCSTSFPSNPILPINCSNECYDWLDMSSLIDTPNSAPATDATTAFVKETKEEVFNFEPEYIEFFQRCCDTDKTTSDLANEALNQDAEFINYNETNCQSKSACVSPDIDSWMNLKLVETSPKSANGLPPISTISEQFQSNYLDHERYPDVDTKQSLIKNEFDYNYYNNFNFDTEHDEKNDREDKNIWNMLGLDNTSQSESPTDNMFADGISNPTIESSNGESKFDFENQTNATPLGMENKKWICEWKNCFNVYPEQSDLVRHIEKTHIEVKKGDVFSCYWQNCTRENKPFNARYKLLIHMRVHSGEKPNKCEFAGCDKSFSRLENLKIHQRSHTGERPYGCQFQGCSKVFSNSSDRAKHQRTHYDAKPYGCQLPGCSKRYTDPSSLRKHVKNHAVKDQAVTKKKVSKELFDTPKKSTSSLRNRNKSRFTEQTTKDNGQFIGDLSQRIDDGGDDGCCQNEFKHINIELNDLNNENKNTIDLMDISKCILGIEDETICYNDFETIAHEQDRSQSLNHCLSHSNEHGIKIENTSDEFVSIEVIKKYLNEASIEFSDLTTLNQLNDHSYNSF